MRLLRCSAAAPARAGCTVAALGAALLAPLAAAASSESLTPEAAPSTFGRAAGSPATLAWQVPEGLNLNCFLRQGDVAAHLVPRSGARPRILVAFPAGDSGVGIWFEGSSKPLLWRLDEPPHALTERDARGRPLRGIAFEVTVLTPRLRLRRVLLSSIRVLRDYQMLRRAPDSVATAPQPMPRGLLWSRDRLDGAPGYRLALEVTAGRAAGTALIADEAGRISLRIRAMTGAAPLTGLDGAQLFAAREHASGSRAERSARATLSFLAYREKLLAGSWRFDTYFGRDTLIAVRLLMPALAPQAIETALSSVLIRLSASGEVAHEEEIGEFAILDHLRREGTRSAQPLYDYRMVDGDYLLAPVAAAWLLDETRGAARAREFLATPARTTADEPPALAAEPAGALLLRNLRRVVLTAAAFAHEPSAAHLIALKPGLRVGDWRDSEQGLAGGRYPFDVNAALVPAALEAAARLHASGLLERYETGDDVGLLAAAAAYARVWAEHAPPLFLVRVPRAQASAAIAAYARGLGLPAANLEDLPPHPLTFHALSLDAHGAPIPVLHSDEAFVLEFDRPDPASLELAAALLLRRFPAGLLTGAGMVVADPVFAGERLQSDFSRNAYHGVVVWSWQQALFAAGLERQLRRADLPGHTREVLDRAQRALWAAIDATAPLRNSELWTWAVRRQAVRAVPFGAARQDADESNAAQLWSTVYLAVRAPSEPPAVRGPAE